MIHTLGVSIYFHNEKLSIGYVWCVCVCVCVCVRVRASVCVDVSAPEAMNN